MNRVGMVCVMNVFLFLVGEDGDEEDLPGSSVERIHDRLGNYKVGEACPSRREKMWEGDIANSGSFSIHGIHDWVSLGHQPINGGRGTTGFLPGY